MLRSLTTTATTACARASLCRLSARPPLSGLVMQTQHLSRHLSTTSTVAALQAENARLHALVNETALDNQRLILRVMSAVVPDEEVAASPALLQMLRDQVIRLEKVQEVVGHELERLADPEAAKYATATAVTISGTAGLHAQVTEQESQQHTRATIIASGSDGSSSSRIWFLPLLAAFASRGFLQEKHVNSRLMRLRNVWLSVARWPTRRDPLVLDDTGGRAHAHDHEAPRCSVAPRPLGCVRPRLVCVCFVRLCALVNVRTCRSVPLR